MPEKKGVQRGPGDAGTGVRTVCPHPALKMEQPGFISSLLAFKFNNY